MTEENLLDLRFAPTTLLIVHLMTKRAGEPEQVYYARLRACDLARRLKLDADSNSDPARLALLDAPLRTRLTEKYDKARRRSRT